MPEKTDPERLPTGPQPDRLIIREDPEAALQKLLKVPPKPKS